MTTHNLQTVERAWDECVAVIRAKFFAGPIKDMVLGWLTNPYRKEVGDE